MTATKHTTIWCDVGDCQAWTDHGQSTVGVTRRLAAREGWEFRNGTGALIV